MTFPLAYSTLHWKESQLKQDLIHLKEAGSEG